MGWRNCWTAYHTWGKNVFLLNNNGMRNKRNINKPLFKKMSNIDWVVFFVSFSNFWNFYETLNYLVLTYTQIYRIGQPPEAPVKLNWLKLLETITCLSPLEKLFLVMLFLFHPLVQWFYKSIRNWNINNVCKVLRLWIKPREREKRD